MLKQVILDMENQLMQVNSLKSALLKLDGKLTEARAKSELLLRSTGAPEQPGAPGFAR